MNPKVAVALLVGLIACNPARGWPGGGKGSSGKGGSGMTPVKGYTKKDGTPVRPHDRTLPAPRTSPPPSPRSSPPPAPPHVPRTSPPAGTRGYAVPVPIPMLSPGGGPTHPATRRPGSPPAPPPRADGEGTDHGEPPAGTPPDPTVRSADEAPQPADDGPPLAGRVTALPTDTMEQDRPTAAGGSGGLLCAAVALSLVYLAPTLAAAGRRHPHLAPILFLNAALGWTVVGWAVALAWAYSAPAPRRRGDSRPRQKSGPGRPAARPARRAR